MPDGCTLNHESETMDKYPNIFIHLPEGTFPHRHRMDHHIWSIGRTLGESDGYHPPLCTQTVHKKNRRDKKKRALWGTERRDVYLEDFASDETLAVVALDAKLALIVLLTIGQSISVSISMTRRKKEERRK